MENSSSTFKLPRLRAGIIGCGRIGVEFEDSHLNAYIGNSRVDFMGFQDEDIDKSIHLAKTHSWSLGFTDHSDMVYNRYENLARNCDIVSVCTPPETHCQIVCDIAPYVKAIYCEKPIATTLEDADKMIKACHDYGVVLQVNHQRRWMNFKFKFGRGILNTGTHAFDLKRQLFRDDANIEMVYIDTDDYIFNVELMKPDEPLIPKGLAHLIDCLDNHHESISSGEEARETLSQVLEYKYETSFYK